LEQDVSLEIDSFENTLTVDIDWDATETILRPSEYVEHWRISLWNKAFKRYVGESADIKFCKGDKLLEFEEGPLAVKRVAYR
jgi:hypothetical protein